MRLYAFPAYISRLPVCISRGCKLHYAQSVCGRGCMAQRRLPDHLRPNRQPNLYYPFLSLLVEKIDTNKPRTRTTYCNYSTPQVIPTLPLFRFQSVSIAITLNSIPIQAYIKAYIRHSQIPYFYSFIPILFSSSLNTIHRFL